MAERKPLIILAALLLVAVAVYLVGVAGAGRGESAALWPDWAGPGSAPGDPLTPADLTGSDGCSIDGAVISVAGTCRVTVRATTEGWPWQAVPRRARLGVVAGPVDLRVTLAGKALKADLDPGDEIRLTYTREGGDFTLTCRIPTGCVVTLRADA